MTLKHVALQESGVARGKVEATKTCRGWEPERSENAVEVSNEEEG